MKGFVPALLKELAATRGIILAAIVLFLSGASFAQRHPAKQAPTPVPQEQGTVSFHNDDVTVRKLSLAPGESAAIPQSTPDYLLVSFAQAALAITGFQTDLALNLANGDMQVLQGGWPHKIENRSSHPVQLLLIEVARGLSPKSALCGLAGKNCHETKYGESSGGEYRQATLFETETAKLFRVQLGSHVAIHQHSDGRRHLLIALTDFQGHADDDSFALHSGETHWHPGSIEELGNDGPDVARFLLLELKKKY